MLGYLAAVQYPAPVAVGVTAVVAAPAVLLGIVQLRAGPVPPLARVLALAGVLAAAACTGAHRLHGYYYGPSHPPSALRAVPVDRVLWSWAGALSPTSFTVTARLVAGARQARLVVAPESGSDAGSGPGTGAAGRPGWPGWPGWPRYSPVQAAAEETGRAVRLTVTGLAPGRRYGYAVQVDGRLDRVARGPGQRPGTS